MGVVFEKKRRIFHLFTEEFSYYIHINCLNYLIHLYDGPFLDDISKERTSERWSERFAFLNEDNERCDEDYYFSMLASNMECASFGKADKRNAYAIIEDVNGIDLTNFLYIDHEVINGIEKNYPYPHVKFTSKDAKTLIIHCKDENRDIYLDLFYVVSEKYNCLVKYSKIINKCETSIRVNKFSSFELDLTSSDFDILSLKGTWNNDREIEKIPLNHGITKIGDNHGSRGFYHNPSLALIKKDTTFDSGFCYGLSIIYSGDFSYEFSVDEVDQTRVIAGFNSETTAFYLKKDEVIYSPQVILMPSFKGINYMTQKFHNLIRERIIPQKFVNKERPILLNSWEACYFDFDTEKIKNFIDEASKLNIELVVLDDGWFGKRNNDTSSLGDWFVNVAKINLDEIIDYAHSKKMKVGIWVEPEMISANSKLYREHPEYALFARNYGNPTLLRHQLVLDLVNENARDNVFEQLTKIFDNYKIDYVKWDFNRFLSEAYSEKLDSRHKKETIHRFVLGTYDLLERFTKRYPNILLETCASGGGRFDLGMLYYSPQIWGSDETDISQRANINFATNLFYPLSSIGTHISDRNIGSIQDKACLAFFGTYGFELDITKLNEEDKKKIIEFNGIYKKWHSIVTTGDYYAIFDPFNSNYCSFNVVTKDKDKCAVYFMNYRKEATKSRYIKLKGLESEKYYFNSLTNEIFKGAFYMNVGLNISIPLNPFTSMVFILKEVNELEAIAFRKIKQKDGGKRERIV